jgi:hypothetical protein
LQYIVRNLLFGVDPFDLQREHDLLDLADVGLFAVEEEGAGKLLRERRGALCPTAAGSRSERSEPAIRTGSTPRCSWKRVSSIARIASPQPAPVCLRILDRNPPLQRQLADHPAVARVDLGRSPAAGSRPARRPRERNWSARRARPAPVPVMPASRSAIRRISAPGPLPRRWIENRETHRRERQTAPASQGTTIGQTHPSAAAASVPGSSTPDSCLILADSSGNYSSRNWRK